MDRVGPPARACGPRQGSLNDNYGDGGNHTVWVAPSDEIYSYLLVRDHATVTLSP